MLEVLLRVILAFFCVAGVVAVFRMVWFHLLRTRNSGSFYLILPISGHDEEAEMSLRSAAERIKWIGSEARLLCVDRGMDEETRSVCEFACRDYPEIEICRPEELENILNL